MPKNGSKLPRNRVLCLVGWSTHRVFPASRLLLVLSRARKARQLLGTDIQTTHFHNWCCHQKGPELGEEFSNIFQLHLVTQRFSCNYNRRPFLTIQDWGGASCASSSGAQSVRLGPSLKALVHTSPSRWLGVDMLWSKVEQVWFGYIHIYVLDFFKRIRLFVYDYIYIYTHINLHTYIDRHTYTILSRFYLVNPVKKVI